MNIYCKALYDKLIIFLMFAARIFMLICVNANSKNSRLDYGIWQLRLGSILFSFCARTVRGSAEHADRLNTWYLEQLLMLTS